MSDRPLAGRTVVTTRDERGRLDSLLARDGADVVHVPLIEIVDRDGAADELVDAIDALGDDGWVVVTSHHGATRVGALVSRRASLRLAAVGRSTAHVFAQLAGRPVDVVPARQTAADLVAAMPEPSRPGQQVLVAQADRAGDSLSSGLSERGFDVTVVVAYENRRRQPTAVERDAALAADAVAVASGSAAEAWVAAFGDRRPRVVAAIGPSTERAARSAGLEVTHVAADHTVEGLAAEIAAALRHRS